MKYRSAALLSAFFLLFCLKPYAGKEGEGAATQKLTTPAGQSERRSKGGIKAPAKGAEKVQAGQRHNAAKPERMKPHDREERSATLNLDQIKRALAQISADLEREEPLLSPQHYGRRVELTLQESIDIALKSNLSIHIAELTRDSVETEILKR